MPRKRCITITHSKVCPWTILANGQRERLGNLRRLLLLLLADSLCGKIGHGCTSLSTGLGVVTTPAGGNPAGVTSEPSGGQIGGQVPRFVGLGDSESESRIADNLQ